ncbi:hypothetical protein [Streptomyces sp. NBC_00239]|uniref:hypothetical protein n=1 Tax=Streptomyces sp. NBC_00239 TaxID=2903640 RepID=UPI002E2AF4FA|nr:hypothetical protein [Streptomyces sp. NBC_00239]
MRTVRTLTTALLAGAGLLGLAGAAAAASPTPSQSADGPTEAGTSFRTAARVAVGQEATAEASTGDYLYWAVPLDTGQRATVRATVTLPPAASRHRASTWQVDVYDGLRRRQACTYGTQTASAAADAASVTLSCTLRAVRAGAEAWSNDPLPGTYYIRLTVVDLAQEDLGQPVRAQVRTDVSEHGGAYAVDGALGAPLVPGATTAQAGGGSAALEPDGGWSGGRWSDRWLWTAAGGVLGALAGIGGYCLTRGTGRPARPTGV